MAGRAYRAGDALEDYCRACKMDRMHTVVAADPAGQPIRVVCGYCRSEHNYRGGPRLDTAGEPEPPARASSRARVRASVIGFMLRARWAAVSRADTIFVSRPGLPKAPGSHASRTCAR